jgi:protein involved in polysaccharide export with SLBB domain
LFTCSARAELALKPSDLVSISSRPDTEFDGTYRVQSNGAIFVPSIGFVVVGTRTISSVERLLENRIRSDFGKSVKISLSLSADKHSLLHISGAVETSQSFLIKKPIPLAVAIQSIKLKSDADVANAEITSIFGQKIGAQELVQPGDRIFIPSKKALTVSVLNGVTKPGVIDLKEKKTLKEVIDLCGGLIFRARPERIFIQRKFELGPLSLTKQGDFEVLPGDTIRIEVDPNTQYVSITGLVRTPLNLEWTPDLTLISVLKAAGGVIYPKGVIVVKSNTNRKRNIRLKVADLEKDSSKDVKIEPNDIVDVLPK